MSTPPPPAPQQPWQQPQPNGIQPTAGREIPPPGFKGTGAWALGFLAYIPIPFFAQFVTGLIMAGVYPTHKKRGPIARANARNAANWGLTYAILTVVFIGLAIVFAMIVSNDGSTNGPSSLTALPFIPISLWLVLGLVHVVVTIVGTVKASKGEVFRFPLAIRFIAE
ncbi:uncharacterized protein DUF4870 [Labedella gwakjiensis]|uniref:DUF4870 domain-containing protein n=1 Tax=Labedella gwakjiensis TaxID=390269 RepID=A0A2P8GWD0_9MICO|nr:DUF4870 domain-containing protein [Labedella gwakjiensis]PSL38264.1 uncharacterized protein DUF4870 [Labedella gwakjiensis]RUQ87198.1 DUF4870 domain-containing protein [Labedella gwakjiensis]